jgi:hypothetical protein
MLWADKRALETNLKLSLLQIRERELNFYTNNCLAISTQSALLAGFAYAALMPGISLGDAGGVAAHVYAVKLMYLTCAVSALGLQLITVVSTTLLSMLGPGLALRGPDGSMHTAVDGMVDEYRNAFYTFLFGMLATLAAGALYCWLMFPAMEASILTSMILLITWAIVRYIRRLFETFAVPKELLVTGRYEASEMTDAGGAAGVVSRGELNTLSHLIGKGGGGGRVGGVVSYAPTANDGLRHPTAAATPTADLAGPSAPMPPTANGKSVSRQ